MAQKICQRLNILKAFQRLVKTVQRCYLNYPSLFYEVNTTSVSLQYDVKAVLEEAGHKLKDVRELLDKNGIVFDNHRRLLVRTLTKYLFFESVR